MVGEQFAIFRWYGRYRGLDGGVQGRDACRKRIIVGRVVIGVLRITGRQVVPYDLGVTQRQDGVGPEVRVGMSKLFRKGEVELPLVGADGLFPQTHDGGPGLEVGLGHLQGRFFQEQAIEEDQVRAGQGGGHGGSRFESV